MSADGERGHVWGINVLAPYIMASVHLLNTQLGFKGSDHLALQIKELAPLLHMSPSSLPFPPRIIYTSSLSATANSLKSDPLNDYQLLSYSHPYGMGNYPASKFMGDLVMVQSDRELGGHTDQKQSPLRCLIAEPGVIATGIFDNGLAPWNKPLQTFLWAAQWAMFFLVRSIAPPRDGPA